MIFGYGLSCVRGKIEWFFGLFGMGPPRSGAGVGVGILRGAGDFLT